MSTLRVHPQRQPLSGVITVPGDKSISHRAVLLAALARGTSLVRGWLPAGDTLATLAAVRQLGVSVDVAEKSPQAWDLTIEGRGLDGLRAPEGVLDCRNAGTCIRLLAGIMAGQPFPSILDGSDQLRTRPMRRIVAPLGAMGARIEAQDGRAPLRIEPASLRGIGYEMPVASAQVKSALLLAGLYATGPTRVRQPGPARDHTERMLAAMGVDISTAEAGWVTLHGGEGERRPLHPLDLTVPGDISSAAFPLVAALLVPGSTITINNVGLNDTRTGLLDVLRHMGAEFQVDNERTTGGEPAGDLTVRFDELRATAVAGSTVVRAIDEFPILAVAATQAAGSTIIRDAAELRVKEVDRIGVLAGELRKLGAAITEQADGFDVDGPRSLAPAAVDSHGDHRLGMALAIAGLLARSGAAPTRIADADCVADSFPGFVETMQRLGAAMEWTS